MRQLSQGMQIWPAGSLSLRGCTLKAHEPCNCSVSEREPGVSDRDFSDLMDGGAYMSEAWFHSDRWADKWQDMAAGEGLGQVYLF